MSEVTAILLKSMTSATFEARTSEHEPNAATIHRGKVNAINAALVEAGVDFKIKHMNPADTLVTHILVGHDMTVDD